MDDILDRVGAERAWAGAVAAIVAVLALGSALFPRTVYVGFIWEYFWGPVYADAHGADCAAWVDGGPQLYDSCGAVPGDAAATASPGYTWVSEIGYVVTLVILILGVVLLIRRLGITRYRAGFYGLFPFFLFGGALRVVEDANVAALRETGEMVIPFPWSGFIISPLIYFTVFFVALAAVVTSVWLDREGHVEGYEYPLAAIGGVALAVTIGYLGYVSATESYVGFHPLIPTIVLVGATVATAATWAGITRFAPELNRGTGRMGIVVIWAHAVDGVANVLMLDWAQEFGLSYNPKHPANEAVVDVTSAVLPGSITAVTGTAWPFLLVKIAAAVFVIWIFDDEVFEDSPRYSILLMVTVVAVGLGPGSRDMIRATFGI